MTPDEILSYPPRVLSQARREAYFEKGFVSVQEIVPSDILKELQATTQGFVNKSREVRESDERFDIGPGHSAQTPVLRRLKSPDTASDIYWNFSTGLMAEVAADLVGPNVVFHHSKLNFKFQEMCFVGTYALWVRSSRVSEDSWWYFTLSLLERRAAERSIAAPGSGYRCPRAQTVAASSIHMLICLKVFYCRTGGTL